MAKLQLIAYFPSKYEIKYALTENVTWSKKFYPNGYVLTPPLPCDQAVALYHTLQKRLHKKLLRFLPGKLRLGFSGFPLSLAEIPEPQTDLEPERLVELLREINRILSGRILEDNLLVAYLRKQGWWSAEIYQALDSGYQQGLYQFFPGVIGEPWGVLRCTRCNSLVSQSKPCWHCGREYCAYCTTCGSLGEIKACSRLWIIADDTHVQKDNSLLKPAVLHLDYSLTLAQQKASQGLVHFLEENRDQILVWAACGAGKTEVSFAAIQRVLQTGQQVLFAIPRRDVVVELAERLERSFPNTSIAVHYGGQAWETDGQLVVATTHQALRFYRRFALVILDESDAFPYQGSDMLRFAIQRAKKPQGKIIEMTATPAKIPAKSGYLTIPARYHGHPLPEPQFLKVKLPNWTSLEQENLPLDILTILAESTAPWFVFVPTIAACKLVGEHLAQQLQIPVCYCYAADPEKDYKKQALLSGKYRIMVTTSIMERGITIPNIQVLVLYSDHPVFSANSLIQMAGRVGRTQQYPKGQVLFVGHKLTNEMRSAIAKIKFLNQQAAKNNLLVKGSS